MQGKDTKKDIPSVKSVAPAPSKEAGGREDPKVIDSGVQSTLKVSLESLLRSNIVIAMQQPGDPLQLSKPFPFPPKSPAEASADKEVSTAGAKPAGPADDAGQRTPNKGPKGGFVLKPLLKEYLLHL